MASKRKKKSEQSGKIAADDSGGKSETIQEGEQAGFKGSPTKDSSPKSQVVRRAITPKMIGLIALILIAATASTLAITYFNEKALREAKEYLDKEDAGAALVLVNAFLEDNPDHDHALTIKARALTLNGEFEEATSIYQRVGTPELEDMKLAARGLLFQHKWQTAMPLLALILTTDIGNAEAQYDMTRCQYMLGMYDKAKESAMGLMNIEGKKKSGTLMMALIEARMKNLKASAEWYKQTVAIENETTSVPEHLMYVEYGYVLFQLGQHEEAYHQFVKSEEISPNVAARAGMGQSLVEMGKYKDAEFSYQKALQPQLPPDIENSRKSVEALARLALDRGEAQRCVELLSQMMSSMEIREIKSSTTYLLEQGLRAIDDTKRADKLAILTKKKRKEEKLRSELSQGAIDSPGNIVSLIFRAYEFAERKNYGQAAEILGQIPDDQDDPKFMKTLRKVVSNKSGEVPSLADLPLNSFQ